MHGGRDGGTGYGSEAAVAGPSSSNSLQGPSERQALHPPTLTNTAKGKEKAKAGLPFDLIDSVHRAEATKNAQTVHRFEVTIEPASFSAEKYSLYKAYQMAVHGDLESKLTEESFKRFLCDSPLKVGGQLDSTK